LHQEYRKRLLEMYESYQNNRSLVQKNEAERLDYYMMWAHQIKTPIAAIKLLIQSNLDGTEDSVGQGDIAQYDHPDQRFPLERELFKIESYVEMVLHYLRLDSISADMVLKHYNIMMMVKRVVKKYAVLFIDRQIAIELTEESKAIGQIITTDEKWFSFIIEQLLSNAIKYTPSGTISILLEGDRLIIADTGIGIRTEDLPRIFERGFTGYNGRIDQKATGIGLYLSKQVASRLGIGISVLSQSGAGTRVILDLSDLTKM
jgi:signal transduction histidine kinase